jgi:tRNA(Ile)-lysidine synthase
MVNLLKNNCDNIVDDVYYQLQNIINQTNINNLVIGLSGGVDSVVLLNIINSIKIKSMPLLNITAIHVNHNISPNSKQWEIFCNNICDKLGIKFNSYQLNIERNGGESLENIARIKRYQIFEQHSNNNIITLAHHNNDQFETIISQIIRGSDIHNIAGMRPISIKSNMHLWRPLLKITKQDIESYAKYNSIEYIIDESNDNEKFLRNFVRHSIIPLLFEYDNNIINKINNLSTSLQNSCDLIDDIAQSDLKSINDGNNNILLVSKLKNLSNLRQINVINYLLKQNGLLQVSQNQIKEFVRQINKSSWDKKPSIRLNETKLLIKNKNLISIIDI